MFHVSKFVYWRQEWCCKIIFHCTVFFLLLLKYTVRRCPSPLPCSWLVLHQVTETMWCWCWVSSLCVRAGLWGTRVLCALSTQSQHKSRRVSLPVAAMLVFDVPSSYLLSCSYTRLLTGTQRCSSWISAKCCFQSVNAVLSAHPSLSSPLSLFSFDWIRRTSCQVASHWSSGASL